MNKVYHVYSTVTYKLTGKTYEEWYTYRTRQEAEAKREEILYATPSAKVTIKEQ